MLAERDAKITLFHKEKDHLLRLKLDGTEAVSEKFTDPTEAEQAAVICKSADVTCTSVSYTHLLCRVPAHNGTAPAEWGDHHSAIS